MSLFCPSKYYDSIYQIDLEHLKTLGIKGLIIDLDNTLLPWKSEEVSASLQNWLNKLKKDFKVCLVSNAGGKRALRMARRLGLPIIAPARKPARKSFEKSLKLLGLSVKEVAVIGDQIFTDIFGGNRLGMYTILVKPVSEREFWATRLISRRLERLVIRRLEEKMS